MASALALDGRTDGDVANLDVIRLLDGKGDGAGDGGSRGSRAAGSLMTRPGLQGCGVGACLEALEVQKVTRRGRDRLPAS
jgi:hypothetical protein